MKSQHEYEKNPEGYQIAKRSFLREKIKFSGELFKKHIHSDTWTCWNLERFDEILLRQKLYEILKDFHET